MLTPKGLPSLWLAAIPRSVNAPEEVMMFDLALEGLFVQSLKGELQPRCRERLRQAGLDLDRKLLPAYPTKDFVKWLHIVAEEVFPTRPAPEVFRELGRRSFGAFTQGLLGGAMGNLMRLIGPARPSRGSREASSPPRPASRARSPPGGPTRPR